MLLVAAWIPNDRGAGNTLLNFVALLHAGSLAISVLPSLAGDHHHRPLASCRTALMRMYRMREISLPRSPIVCRAKRKALAGPTSERCRADRPGTSSANTSEKNFATPLNVRSIASYLPRGAEWVLQVVRAGCARGRSALQPLMRNICAGCTMPRYSRWAGPTCGVHEPGFHRPAWFRASRAGSSARTCGSRALR